MKKGLFICISFLFLLSFWIPVNASPVNSLSQADITPTPSTASEQPDLSDGGNLTEVNRWGYGPLQAVRFSADGDFFIAASSYGLAKFSMEKINQKPIWMPFKEPIGRIKDLQISLKGDQAILFLKNESSDFMLVDLNSGEIVDQIYEDNWTEKRDSDVNVYDGLSVTSPDITLAFKSRITSVDLSGTEDSDITRLSDEKTIEEVYNNTNNSLLFPLGMETQYIYFKDRTDPEGCDLEFFSPCGNSLLASPLVPYMAAFSDNNRYLAVRYRTTESNIFQKFQLVRIFNTNNGKLLYSIGGAKQPAIDFAFQPGSGKILVGFLDGSLQLWNSDGASILWQTRFFTERASKVTISNDKKYIVYEGILGDIEVRKTVDGKILSTYKAVASALAPKHNLLALGLENGTIQVEDLDNLRTISRMTGHKKKVLAMAFSPDEKTLVTSGQDCGINAWSTQSGKYLHAYGNNYIIPYEDMVEKKSRVFINNLVFIGDSGALFGFGSWGTALNWTASNGKLNYYVKSESLDYSQGMVTLKPNFPDGFEIDQENSTFNIGDKYYDLITGESTDQRERDQIPMSSLGDIYCNSTDVVTKDNQFQYSLGYTNKNYFVCKWNFINKTILSTSRISASNEESRIQPGDPILSPDDSFLYIPTSDGVTFVFKVPG